MSFDAWKTPAAAAGPELAATDAPAAAVEPPPTFKSTDLGNAEYFAHHLGDRVRFDHRRKRWLIWDTPTWRLDADGAVSRLAHQGVRQRQVDALSLDDSALRDAAAKWALKSESRERLTAMLTLAQSCPPLATSGETWDRDPWLFACQNGVIDLQAGILRPGSPDDNLTLRSPVVFDPEATAPRFEQFLTEIFDGDPARVEWLQRAIGYTLTGITREQAWILMRGTGGNGKGVLTRTLHHVLGDYGFTLPFSTFEARQSGIPNDLAAITGRRFVTASETNDGARLNEARVKSLTGEDDITARFLHGEFFTFRPVSKLWLSVNHRPVVRDLSAGFWRRLREIPFERTFDIDPTLEPTLLAEAPGILAWAVRGCLRWQQDGLGNLPSAVADAIADYRAESDVLADYLAARCVCITGVAAKSSALFADYTAWAESSLARDDRLTLTAFGRALSERGFTKTRTSQGVSYHGIALKPYTAQAA